jgi:hypothetical protein
MSPTPDSTLADPQQIIASLRRKLDECRAERDKAQRKLDERTTERDEALAQQTATAEVSQVNCGRTVTLPSRREVAEPQNRKLRLY